MSRQVRVSRVALGRPLLATCSVLAIMASVESAGAGGLIITTPQPFGVTNTPGNAYLTITGANAIVTGNVTNPLGVTLAPGAVVTGAPGYLTPPIDALTLLQATVNGAVVNAGTITTANGPSAPAANITAKGIYVFNGVITQGLTNSGTVNASIITATNVTFAQGISVSNGVITQGLTNSGTVNASITDSGVGHFDLVTGVSLNARQFIGGVTNSGLISVNLAAPSLVAATGGLALSAIGEGISTLGGATFTGAIGNSGVIQASGTLPLTLTAPTGTFFNVDPTVIGTKIASHADITGAFTNSGTIGASLVANQTLSVSGAGIVRSFPKVASVYILAQGGNNSNSAGGSVNGGVTNSGLITASLTHASTLTSSSTGQRASLQANANGLYVNIGGGSAAANHMAGGGSVTGGITNTGSILVNASAATTVNNLVPQSHAVASTYARGITLSVAGGFNTSGLVTAQGGNFTGTITNSGTIRTSLTTSQNGGGAGSISDDASGLEISVRGGNGLALGGTLAGQIINSGTLATTTTVTGVTAGGKNNYAGGYALGVSANGGNGNGAGGGQISGGITNTGLISATTKSAGQSVAFEQSIGIAAQAFGGNAGTGAGSHANGGTFTGDIINRGKIAVSITSAAHASADGIFVAALQGGAAAANSSASSGTFIGNVVNTGLIGVSATGVNASNQKTQVSGVAIDVSGTRARVTAATVVGSVTNTGTITVTSSGQKENAAGIFLNASPTGVFTGAIVNSGTITVLGTNGASGIGIKASGVPVPGGITNTGVIIGSTAAIDLSAVTAGPTGVHQEAGLLEGSVLGSGTGDMLFQTGGTIMLTPTQKIGGFANFTQTGGTLTLEVTPVTAPQVGANAVTLNGTVRIVPLLGSGTFTSSQTFKDVFTAKAPIAFSGASVSSALPIFTASLAPDAVTANALDVILKLNPARAGAGDLTQSLRFGLDVPEVLRDSIRHRLVDGVSYDGGGIATAALSDPGQPIAGGSGVSNDPAAGGGLWARGYGVLGSSSPFDTSRVGLIIGGDWHLGDHLVIGLALDYDHTDARFADAASTKLDAYQGAAYVGWDHGPWYAIGLVGGGINDFSTTRELASFGLTGLATSHPTGTTYDTYGEGGYHWKVENLTLTPYLGAGYTHTSIDAFNESGAFGALAIQTGTSDSFQTMIGVRASTVIALGDHGTLVPELRVGYAHEFLDAAQTLTGSPGATPFSVTGVNFGRDSALIGVGVTHAMSESARIFVDYDGKITGGFQEHALSAGVQISF